MILEGGLNGLSGSTSSKLVEKVVKNLEVFPTMVVNLLQARFSKAKDAVKAHAQSVAQELRAVKDEGSFTTREQLFMQMDSITHEIEQIAGDAIEAAIRECRSHASRQVDLALAALQDEEQGARDTTYDELEEAAMSTKRTLESALIKVEATETRFLVWNALDPRQDWLEENKEEDNVFQETWEDKDDKMPRSVTNQVVAAELLKAKAKVGNPCETNEEIPTLEAQVTQICAHAHASTTLRTAARTGLSVSSVTFLIPKDLYGLIRSTGKL
jgi:hypothetical protein